MKRVLPILIVIILALATSMTVMGNIARVVQAPFSDWTLEEAVEVLNKSPWARQETYSRVLGGVGSGLQGEKEIYNTFFVRLLSAPPIRKAFARVKQIQIGYDSLPESRRVQVDRQIARGLNLNVQDWIVVTVSFRSNNPNQQASVQQFLEQQTTETVKNRAYLSTTRFPKLELVAYYPPREQSVGAKFVFPRQINGVPAVSPKDGTFVFEFDVPGASPQLTATFSVSKMIVDGELLL
ncbi:MAG TPA: hypothetical protein VKZ59_07850 [Acidobacteriota bacterium]|nr:hypothetical protein [Acidobacteriota bacterium]